MNLAVYEQRYQCVKSSPCEGFLMQGCWMHVGSDALLVCVVDCCQRCRFVLWIVGRSAQMSSFFVCCYSDYSYPYVTLVCSLLNSVKLFGRLKVGSEWFSRFCFVYCLIWRPLSQWPTLHPVFLMNFSGISWLHMLRYHVEHWEGFQACCDVCD